MLQTLLAAVLSLVIGAVMLFAGRRVFIVLLPVFGFFAGFWIGAEFMHALIGTGFLGTVSGWVLGIILALIGAVLSYIFFPVGVALAVGVFVAGMVNGVLRWLGIEASWFLTIVGLAVGLVVAWVALWRGWESYIVMALTALGGALLMAMGLALLFGQITTAQLAAEGSAMRPLLDSSIWWSLLVIGLAVAGFILQMRVARQFRYESYDYAEVWSY